MNGEIVLWDFEKLKAISTVKLPGGKAINRVEWNKKNEELIASGSNENAA